MINNSVSDCYLIADEVGLGKTEIARKVVEYVFLNDKRLCLFYVASNSRIAEQNIKKFMPYGGEDLVKSQEKTTEAVIKAFFGKTTKMIVDDAKKVKWQRPSACFSDVDRLSLMNNENYSYDLSIINQHKWNVFNLTPATSFKVDKGVTQEGSKDEKDRYERVFNMLKDVEDVEVHKIPKYEYKELFFIALKFLIDTENKTVYEAIKSKKDESEDNSYFKIMRAAASLVSVSISQPNIIILDEFQRFRYVLDDDRKDSKGSFTVYTIRDFIEYINKNYELEISQPKILLLSATPYQFNMNALDNESEENPFQTFEQLKNTMKKLGANTENFINYIARTERRFFIEDNDNSLFCTQNIDDIIGIDGSRKHNKYLREAYKKIIEISDLDKRKEALVWANLLLQDTPDFWDYKDFIIEHYDIKEDNPIWNLDYSNCCVNDFNKINLVNTIIDQSTLGERLWIPPCTDDKKCGKMIVFMKYHRTSYAVSNIINKKYFNEKATITCGVQKNDLTQKLKSDYLKFEEGTIDAEKTRIASFLADYLLMPHSINVISKNIVNDNSELKIKDIIEYCKKFKLNEVLKEYSLTCKEQLFKYGTYSKGTVGYKEIGLGDDKKIPFAINMLEESVKMDDKEKLALFNSPFFPFVICVTETAQEGIDLHKYSDKIIHWSLPANASAMIQRDGRIDRANSYVIRCRCSQSGNERENDDFKNKYDNALKSGICPTWYIPNLKNYHQITRYFCGSKLSGFYEKDEKMMIATDSYPKFLEGSGKEEFCPFFQ